MGLRIMRACLRRISGVHALPFPASDSLLRVSVDIDRPRALAPIFALVAEECGMPRFHPGTDENVLAKRAAHCLEQNLRLRRLLYSVLHCWQICISYVAGRDVMRHKDLPRYSPRKLLFPWH